VDTGLKLLEGLRLSFYELIAVLLPGFSFLVLAHVYAPSIQLEAAQGIPNWLVLVGAAFLIGHVLKGLADLLKKVEGFKNLFPPKPDFRSLFIFEKVKLRLAQIYGLNQVPDNEIWNLSFSVLESPDLEKRDRLDANSDMLQSLQVIALFSTAAVLARWFALNVAWQTSILLLALHFTVIYALAIRSKRLSKIADELILWRFFARQCRASETNSPAAP
jgi:hypothetical protein